MPETAPYGSWKSPVTSDRIVAETVRLGGATAYGGAVHGWKAVPPSRAATCWFGG